MGVDLASLVLAVDSTQVDKGASALDRLAQAGSGASSSSQTFALAGLAVAAAAATAAAATIALTKQAIDAADAMNDLHLKTGLAFSDLAAYDLLARQSGSSIDGVAQGIKFLGKSITDNRKELIDLGVTSADTGVALGQFADLIARISDPALKTTLSMKYLDRAGVELIPTLSGGSAAIDEARRQTQRYGELLERTAPQADRFNDLLAVLATRSKEVGFAVADKFLPLLSAIAENSITASDGVSNLDDALDPLVEVFKVVTALGGNVAFVLRAVGTEIGGMAAQAAAVARGDLVAFVAIGEAMTKDAEKNRTAFDAWEKKILAVGTAAAEAGEVGAAGIKKLTKAEEDALRTSEERAKAEKKAVEESAKIHADAVKAADSFVAAIKKEVDTYGMSEAEKKRYEATTLSLTLTKGKEREAFLRSAEAVIAADVALKGLSAEARIHNDIVTQFIEEDDKANKKIEDGIKSLRTKIESTNEETLALVLTADQLREHLILRELEKSGLDASTEAYKRMDEQLRKATDANTQAKAAKKAADDVTAEWKRMTDDIERALTDALMRGFENGKDGGQAFVDSIKNYLKTAAFKIAVQAIVNPIMGAMSSVLSAPGSTGSSVTSMASGANALSSLSMTPFANAGGSFAYSSAGQAMGLSGAAWEGSSIKVLTESGQVLQGATQFLDSYGGYIMAAYQLSQGNYGAAAGGAIGAYFGGPIGSMIGSTIGSALFGDGGGEDPHNNAQVSGYEFALSRSGAVGVPNADYVPGPTSLVAGPTSGAGWWADNMVLSSAQIAAINQQVALTFAQGDALARMLGIDPSVINSASVDSRSAGVAATGYMQGYFSSIEQAFTALSASIATKIIPNLSAFQQSGESLAQTASRLAEEFAFTNQVAAMMGREGAAVFGDNSLKGRDELVQMLGGLTGATNTLGSYYQNFYGASEREADAKGNIANTLRAIGIVDLPDTREQFRALVEGQDLATESGRSMYATLISVSEAFAGTTKAIDDTAFALESMLSTNQFKTRQDYLYAKVTGTAPPAYASGGDHPGGWAVVGEQGPELRNMSPSRIYSNSDSKALFDTSELQAEVAALRADLRAIGATLARTGKRTIKTLERWDSDGLPAERTLV